MLSTSNMVGFVATAQPDKARDFYEKRLGLTLVEDSPFALVFATGSNTLRVQKVETVCALPYTSLGWEVSDIAAVVDALTRNNIELLRFEGLPQNDAGIWQTPDGAQIAWFKDADGNTLSVTQAARG